VFAAATADQKVTLNSALDVRHDITLLTAANKVAWSANEYMNSGAAGYLDAHWADDDKGMRFYSGANLLLTIRRVIAGESTRTRMEAPTLFRFFVNGTQGISLSDTGINLRHSPVIGIGAAGVDYTLTFNGQTNDGVVTWMEDEDYFSFNDDIVIAGGESLTLSDTTAAGDGVIYKGADRFIHNFQHPTGGGAVPVGLNTFVGVNAGNFTLGSTATVPNQGSYNVGIGDESLAKLTSGYFNFACGTYGLGELTAGYGNVGIGADAGRFIADGLSANSLAAESIFIGGSSKASANGIQDEIVIGYGAIGQGSHTLTLGHTTITNSYIRGNLTIGQGTAATDYTLTFDGETADGVLTWMEDESRFDFSAPIRMASIKSGATQGAAGAAAGELWKTASHATLPDNVVMIGV